MLAFEVLFVCTNTSFDGLFFLSLLMYSMCHMSLLGLQLIDILDVNIQKLGSLRLLRNWREKHYVYMFFRGHSLHACLRGVSSGANNPHCLHLTIMPAWR